MYIQSLAIWSVKILAISLEGVIGFVAEFDQIQFIGILKTPSI
jgi:hypothetical protein